MYYVLYYAAKSLFVILLFWFLLQKSPLNSQLTTLISLPLSSVPSGPGDEMGTKASSLDGPGQDSELPSATLANIQEAYEEKQEEVARELIQQACCVECSTGIPHIDGVSTLKI